jgi:hypothetical protein
MERSRKSIKGLHLKKFLIIAIIIKKSISYSISYSVMRLDVIWTSKCIVATNKILNYVQQMFWLECPGGKWPTNDAKKKSSCIVCNTRHPRTEKLALEKYSRRFEFPPKDICSKDVPALETPRHRGERKHNGIWRSRPKDGAQSRKIIQWPWNEYLHV